MIYWLKAPLPAKLDAAGNAEPACVLQQTFACDVGKIDWTR